MGKEAYVHAQNEIIHKEYFLKNPAKVNKIKNVYF